MNKQIRKFSKSSKWWIGAVGMFLVAFSVIYVQFSSNSSDGLTEAERSAEQYRAYFEKLARTKGPEAAFDELSQNTYPESVDLHQMGHTIAAELYKREGIEGLQSCPAEYVFGCTHEIIISGLLEYGIDEVETLMEKCNASNDSFEWLGRCYHGLGHGLLAYFGYDMKSTMDYCMIAATDKYEKSGQACLEGAMMEMLAGTHDRQSWELHLDDYFSETDPYFPCNAEFMPEDLRGRCFFLLTPYLYLTAGARNPEMVDDGIIGKTIQYCEDIPDSLSAYRPDCFGGIGRELITNAVRGDTQRPDSVSDERHVWAYDQCQRMSPEGKDACIYEVVYSLYWGGENDASMGVAFCSVMSQEDAGRCYEDLIGLVGEYRQMDGRVADCLLFPSGLQDKCKDQVL